jgi:chromosomal replication initiator protein
MSQHSLIPNTDLVELWAAVQKALTETIHESLLQVWFERIRLQQGERTAGSFSFIIEAADPFTCDWIKERYLTKLNEAFFRVLGAPSQLSFTVKSQPVYSPGINPSIADPRPEPSQLPVMSPLSSSAGMASSDTIASPSAPPTESPFDPRYTFETFVVGKSNQFAYASSFAVAQTPARQYNPLFLHSPPGLGKTHLLHAIGNHILAKNPGLRLGYISAERFVNELVESIQHKKQSAFRSKYRDGFDVLLVDDIQFIAGKETTEEEFFHTFNALHSGKRQIVLTSDRPPEEIEGLEARIRTRFEWGLVVDIQPPEIETRIAILRAKAEREDIYLSDEVATFLASYVKSNVRTLEGILVRLQAQASLTGSEISIEMAKQALKIEAPEESSRVTIESIQAAVANYFNIRVQDLKSPSRARMVALPRQIAMYLSRKYTPVSLREIGGYFGGKDHSTIIHALDKIETALDQEPSLKEKIESIQNLL